MSWTVPSGAIHRVPEERRDYGRRGDGNRHAPDHGPAYRCEPRRNARAAQPRHRASCGDRCDRPQRTCCRANR
jgi:hypothetical protein